MEAVRQRFFGNYFVQQDIVVCVGTTQIKIKVANMSSSQTL